MDVVCVKDYRYQGTPAVVERYFWLHSWLQRCLEDGDQIKLYDLSPGSYD